MAQLNIENIAKGLEKKGVDSDTIEKVKSTIAENIKPGTIDKAVLFLGLVTIALAAGSILLAGLDKIVPEALWGAVGAGIGGLAGIFTGRQ